MLVLYFLLKGQLRSQVKIGLVFDYELLLITKHYLAPFSTYFALNIYERHQQHAAVVAQYISHSGNERSMYIAFLSTIRRDSMTKLR